MERLPSRLYFCPAGTCNYCTETRYVLKNHLIRVHGYGKRDAVETAMNSEYWLNPTYRHKQSLLEDITDEDITDEE